MIKLWKHIIRPVLDAANSKSILEIGAEYGASTNVLINYVNEKEGHLYCIDPMPEFEADELQNTHPQRLTFYRDLSLNVLPGHEPFDVALVDGDHNWYTVYNELKLIEEIHAHDPLGQPIIFLHDIGWPYGRRDLYYDPATIPEEFRQEHKQMGILPNRSELSTESGMNMELWNATHEGGEKNGVLTGVEDYLTESELHYEFVQFPLYYGLGLLVTQQRLEANASLKSAIDELRSPASMKKLVKLAEHMRCVDGVFMQVIDRQRKAAEHRVVELEEQLRKAGIVSQSNTRGE